MKLIPTSFLDFYCIAECLAVGKFGESSMIHQTLASQILSYKLYPYGQNLSICQTLFCQLLLIWQYAKHSRYTVFFKAMYDTYVIQKFWRV